MLWQESLRVPQLKSEKPALVRAFLHFALVATDPDPASAARNNERPTPRAAKANPLPRNQPRQPVRPKASGLSSLLAFREPDNHEKRGTEPIHKVVAMPMLGHQLTNNPRPEGQA
jgi:hypothetical protein